MGPSHVFIGVACSKNYNAMSFTWVFFYKGLSGKYGRLAVKVVNDKSDFTRGPTLSSPEHAQ